MAKQLSMEDLVKKYKFLSSNQNLIGIITPHTDSNQQTQETIRPLKTDSLRYSKSSSLMADGATSTIIQSRTAARNVCPARNSEDACKVCMDAEANCAFIDCGHIVTCLDCAKMLTRCPLCRETIKRTLRIYKS